jgi:hypothetical protein
VKVKPGLKGNPIPDASVERPAPDNAKQATRRQPLSRSAVAFEIVP